MKSKRTRMPVESSDTQGGVRIPDGQSKLRGEALAKPFGRLNKALRSEIEYLPPERLKPYARNPMKHPPEQVAQIVKSIREFGFTQPVLIDEDDMILAGHGRQLAALELKLKEIPTVRRTGFTKAQKKAYVMADNQIARTSDFDWEILADELRDLRDEEFDLDLTGFRDFEREPLLEAVFNPTKTEHTSAEEFADFRKQVVRCTTAQHATFLEAAKIAKEKLEDSKASDGECLALMAKEFLKRK